MFVPQMTIQFVDSVGFLNVAWHKEQQFWVQSMGVNRIMIHALVFP